jgi:type IV secretion system protein VirD4
MSIIEQLFKFIIDIIEAAFKFSFDFIETTITGLGKRKTSYSADFANPATVLSRRQFGFCLTGRRSLSVKNSYQNALVIGGTGTGKSSVVLIPSLYRMKSSFVVHDPSGELFSKSSGYLKQEGYNIKLLNFANPAVSSGYNPLARATTSSDIQKVASLLVQNAFGEKSKDPFWNTQAVALLTILITILKSQAPEFQNLYTVRQLLNLLGSNPEKVDALFSKDADEVLFSEYKAFIAYDEKVINGVIATAKAALQTFSDESVAKVTSFDNLNFQEFRDLPTVLYIQNSVADQKYYSVLTSIFFEQFFSYVLGRFPKKEEQDIFLLIDEASSLNLPTLPLAVANVRKHRAGIMLLVQDFSQLVHNYGRYDADAIKANCFAKMYFTGQSHETTKELEQALGKFEFEDKDGKRMVRPLMTNDEIRTMKTNQALLICGNSLPIKAKLRPFYKNKVYRQNSELPPAYMQSLAVEHILPLLSLTQSSNEKAA